MLKKTFSLAIHDRVQLGSNLNVFIPSDFPLLPCKFYYRGSEIVHNMNFDQYKGGTKIYVKTSGNDTTGDGTLATPYRTITKAVTVIIAGADAKYEVITDIAMFDRDQVVFTQTLTNKTVAFISTSANKTIISSNNTYTWTADGTSYRATRSGVVGVIDNLNRDSKGLPVPLIKVADLATCKATLNSYYADATYIYVRRSDDVLPTHDNTIALIGVNAIDPVLSNSKLYFENFIFCGNTNGNALRVRGTAATLNEDLILNNCFFVSASMTTYGNGLASVALKNTFVFNCISAYVGRDAFNYHYDGLTWNQARTCLVIEYNCVGYHAGIESSSGSDNISSVHEGACSLRINTQGANSAQACIIDVTGSYSVLHKCLMNNPVGFQFTSEGAGSGLGKTYLIDCTSINATTSLTISTTHTVYKRNFTGNGAIVNNGTLTDF